MSLLSTGEAREFVEETNFDNRKFNEMQIAVYNQSGEKVGTVELSDSVFGLKWNAALVHQVVTSQAANLRQGNAHAKGRGEVRGGGRKPWRQKGTGRARHGSIRSPIWRGGGVTHGPLKEKNYKKRINKKMAKKALHTALSAKVRDKELIILDDLKFSEPKTRLADKMFGIFYQSGLKNIKKGNGVLVALAGNDLNSRRVLRNLPYACVTEARNLNAYEVLRFKHLMMPRQALSLFEKSEIRNPKSETPQKS